MTPSRSWTHEGNYSFVRKGYRLGPSTPQNIDRAPLLYLGLHGRLVNVQTCHKKECTEDAGPMLD